jgi:hypothetical protein
VAALAGLTQKETPADQALGVPSVVMNLSRNVLFHPQHPLYGSIEVLNEQDLRVDQRLWLIT